MRYLLVVLTLLFSAGAALAGGKDVIYTVDGESFTGYLYSPEKENKGFVLLIHDWDGLTDYEMKRAAMLGELGYTVFAADMYGTGIRPTETADKKAMTSALTFKASPCR